MPPEPAVAVAVVSWNTRDLLRECLRSLAGRAARRGVGGRQRLDGRVGGDGAVGVPGRPACRSQSTTSASARRSTSWPPDDARAWIAPANADIELRPGALRRAARCRLAPSRAPASSRRGLSCPPARRSTPCTPSRRCRSRARFNLGFHSPRRRPAVPRGLLGPVPERDVDWAIGAFLLVRRAAWNAVGGFDAAAVDVRRGPRPRLASARAGWHDALRPVGARPAPRKRGDDAGVGRRAHAALAALDLLLAAAPPRPRAHAPRQRLVNVAAPTPAPVRPTSACGAACTAARASHPAASSKATANQGPVPPTTPRYAGVCPFFSDAQRGGQTPL